MNAYSKMTDDELASYKLKCMATGRYDNAAELNKEFARRFPRMMDNPSIKLQPPALDDMDDDTPPLPFKPRVVIPL